MTDKPLSPDDFDALVLARYERVVTKAGRDGIKRQEAVGRIAKTIRAAIKRGRLTIETDIEAMVARSVHVRDEQARSAQVDHVRLVVDCINGATILGTDDPIMDQVALAGSGVRKTWRNVSIDDLQAMAAVKTQHAADAAVAANDFFQQVLIITKYLLDHHGAKAVVGDIA
ncbi:MAG: hypothetical protein ABI862_18420 [Ilumatobacteraceae bacterium]